MDLKKIHQSVKVRIAVIVLIVIAVMILIFQAGIFVGYKKAEFSYRFGDNYYRTFGGNKDDFGQGFLRGGKDLLGGHGAVGNIVRVSLPTFVVAGPDKVEKVVLVNSDTVFRKFRDGIDAKDLKVGDFVTILGSPDDKGQVVANLIRIMPPPPQIQDQVTSSTSTVNQVPK